MNTNDIVYLEHDSRELKWLAEAVNDALNNGRHLRVTFDGGFKYKVGEGCWSPPVRSERPNGGY